MSDRKKIFVSGSSIQYFNQEFTLVIDKKKKFKNVTTDGHMKKKVYTINDWELTGERKCLKESYFELLKTIGINLQLLVENEGIEFGELLVLLRTTIKSDLTISSSNISEDFQHICRTYCPHWWNEKKLFDIIELASEIIDQLEKDNGHKDYDTKISSLHGGRSYRALVQEMKDACRKHTEIVNEFFTDRTLEYIDVESPGEESVAIICFDLNDLDARATSEVHDRAAKALSSLQSKSYHIHFQSLEGYKKSCPVFYTCTDCKKIAEKSTGIESETCQLAKPVYKPFLNPYPS